MTSSFASAAPEGTTDATTTAPSKSPSPDAIAEARTRYARGSQLFAEGDYKLAAIEFQRAYDLAPNFQALYNLGQVHYQLNNYAKAAQTLRRYLAEGGSQISPARRKEVENDLKSLVTRTGEVTITANVEGAEVTLDDVPIGRSPINDLLIDAGEHRIGATKPGRERAFQTLVLAGGDRRNVKLDLPEAAGVKVIASGPPKKSYTWVGWVTTGALAAGALTTGIITLFKYTDFRDEKNSPAAPDDPDGTDKRAAIDQKRSRTTTYGVTTGIIGGAALLAGGISLYFTLKESGSSATPTLHVTVNTNAISLGGRF